MMCIRTVGGMQTYTEHWGLVGICNVTSDTIMCIRTLAPVEYVQAYAIYYNIYQNARGLSGGGAVKFTQDPEMGRLGARRGCASLHTTP